MASARHQTSRRSGDSTKTCGSRVFGTTNQPVVGSPEEYRGSGQSYPLSRTGATPAKPVALSKRDTVRASTLLASTVRYLNVATPNDR